MKTVVPWLIEEGYQLVTVSELMAYYYGELLQPGQFYGYTYFTTHGRTDTPLQLPAKPETSEEVPAQEAESGAPSSQQPPRLPACGGPRSGSARPAPGGPRVGGACPAFHAAGGGAALAVSCPTGGDAGPASRQHP